MNFSIGIDIGTTSICGIVVDVDTGEVVKSLTLPNGSFIKTQNSFEKIQDPQIILDKAVEILRDFKGEYKNILSIGLTGQMHGIVYVDQTGNGVSPLYTWQDERGNLPFENSTYAKRFSEITGCNAASGYGLVTHFYNLKNSLVPENAAKISTIHDYVAMKICGNTKPIIHISDGASWGCYDFEKLDFNRKKLKNVGISEDILPEITGDFKIIGDFDGAPVAVAIGDNQASFIGTVNEEDAVLVNVGTGSQVSLIGDKNADISGVEVRPLYKDKCILVGSSLCGGRAYAMLRDFFVGCGKELFGADNKRIYDAMDKCFELAEQTESLKVSTKFCGSRLNPNERGCITGIGIDNFTPAALIKGVLEGMTDELWQFYRSMKDFSKLPIKKTVGSGNGIRLNKPLIKTVENTFNMPLNIPKNMEEAAFGAAIFSLAAAFGKEDVMELSKKLIKYE